MKPWIKFTALGLAGVMLSGVALVAYALHQSDAKMTRRVSLPARSISLSAEAASVERGAYLYRSRGCTDCHGADAGGRIFIDDRKLGMRVGGPDISPAAGSVVAGYTDADWERSVRHGVKPDGRPLMVMPAQDFARWTDADLASLVAYLRQLPPAAGGRAVLELPLPVLTMYGLGLIKDAAATIDHALPPEQPVPEGKTVAHGRYVAQGCQGCHGAGFSGGKVAGAPPDWPAAANLTPGSGSAMPTYKTAADFKSMLRSGKRPDGSAVSPVMPFEALAQLNDTDADALYLYLRSLPPRPAGSH